MKIILASQSPRRIELLKQFGMPFESIPSHIEEVTDVTDLPEKTVMSLAYLKAREISIAHKDALVIASDTLVYAAKPLGKPSNRDEAFEMLNELKGKTHEVFTGVALIHEQLQKKIVFYEKTLVEFNDLTETQILKYIETGEPLDKAGAYGIQGLGSVLVKSIHGDYYNVMGLPLSHLNQQLKQHFNLELL